MVFKWSLPLADRTKPPTSGALDAVVVDVASWNCIGPRNNPKASTGVSGTICAWLNIKTGASASYPAVVNACFNRKFQRDAESLAKYHLYGPGQHVIHAISPQTQDLGSVKELAHAYANVLAEFCEALGSAGASNNRGPPTVLRIPPLGSGPLASRRIINIVIVIIIIIIIVITICIYRYIYVYMYICI